MPDPQPITVYKGDRTLQITPDAYDEARGKGWSMSPPNLGSPTGQPGGSAQAGVGSPKEGKGSGGEVGRMLDWAGKVGEKMSSAGDPRAMMNTLQSLFGPNVLKQTYDKILKQKEMSSGKTVEGLAGNMASTTAPGIARDLIQKKDMTGTAANAGLMMMGGEESPEALKSMAEQTSKSVKRITEGSHSNVMSELEDFRKTVKAKPTTRQMDVARVKHKALGDRVDREWNETYAKMGAKPTDADKIQSTLGELAKKDPTTQAWIEQHIEPSKSGGSVTAPLWAEVQRLQSRLNKQLTNPNLDPVVRGEIPKAIKGLQEAARAAAKKAGVEDKYVRAQQLTRSLENIKYHTAYKTKAITPSPLYGIGGALAGIAAGSSLGVSGELGSAFIGKMVGSEIGKIATPKGRFSVDPKSIAAERQVWKRLGEEPPKNIGKRKIRPDPADSTAR
jgi:hypothetical protein